MRNLKYFITILLLIIGGVVMYSTLTKKIKDLERDKKIINDTLIVIDSTQYSKMVADTLTIKELRDRIKYLEIENIKKPQSITEIKWKIRDGEKTVDTVFLPTEGKPLYVSDYYPNKENPFVNYTLNDTIGKFKFYPTKLSLVVSENRDGTWKVDTKAPEYFEITDIRAVALDRPITKKTTPFYVGGGVQKQNDKYPISVLGGFRIKRTIIFGGVNTDGNVEVKTLYNL